MKRRTKFLALLLTWALLLAAAPAALAEEENLPEAPAAADAEITGEAVPDGGEIPSGETPADGEQEETPANETGAEEELPAWEEEPAGEQAAYAVPAGEDIPAAIAIDGDTATVSTSDEFREAVANPAVKKIVFTRTITVAKKGGEDNHLVADEKRIEPANPENYLIFEDGVTLLHILSHDGNQSAETEDQSIEMIYKYINGDRQKLWAGVPGVMAWYEYHSNSNPDTDKYRGKRVCYVLYAGDARDAVSQAEELTANGWFHRETVTGGEDPDDNRTAFLWFGKNAPKNIVISEDVTMDGTVIVNFGQNLTVEKTLTAALVGLTDKTEGKPWGYLGKDSCRLTVKAGGLVNIHRETDDFLGEARSPSLIVQGRLILEDSDGLIYDDETDIQLVYTSFQFSAKRPEEVLGRRGNPDEFLGGNETLDAAVIEKGFAAGYLYSVYFMTDKPDDWTDRDKWTPDIEEGAIWDGPGWYCSPEGRTTSKVTGMDGVESSGVSVETLWNGRVLLRVNVPGSYKIYIWHHPSTFDGEPPVGEGTGIPGTEGIPLTIENAGTASPENIAVMAESDDPGTTVVEFVGNAWENAGQFIAAGYDQGGLLAGLKTGDKERNGEHVAYFPSEVQENWTVFLLDGSGRPVCPRLTVYP